jgi:hypothetical protein
MNPYYGRISLFRVPLREFLEEEQDSLEPKNFTVCLTDIVPGVITHFSLTNGRLAISYRRLDESLGSVHRFRIYQNLTRDCEVKNQSVYNFIEHFTRMIVDEMLLDFFVDT